FLNIFEPSNNDSNVVNAPQEPFVFSQDPDENSSQSPPHIDHHCYYGCGDPLDGISRRRCTCESCGNGAHIGYNCPPKVLIISNPEPCHNQNVDELPQTLPSFHPTCYFGDENSFAHDSTPNFVNDSPNVFNPPPQPSTDSYEFCRNDAHFSHDCPHEIFQRQPMNHYEPNLCYESNYSGFDKFKPSQFPVIHQPPQETSVEILHDHENVINSVQTFLRKFNRFSVFKMPKVLLLAWDRVSKIKNAFGNKQYKPEDVQELFRKLFNDVQNIHEELAEYINTPSWNRPAFFNYDDDEDEDYTIASPPDFELVSLEEVDDDILREKLLNINLLVAKIESLNDNPTPDHVLKSPSLFSILVEDSDSFLENSDTSLSYSDNSLPEFKTFSDHTEETSSGNTTTHANYSRPKYDSFLFKIEPDQGELTSIVMEYNLGEPRVHVPNMFPTHPTLMLDSDFIPFNNSLPESEIFYFDIEEKNSGSTTIHADISFSDLEYFNFMSEPDPGELTSIVDSRIRENVLLATNVNLSPEDDQSPLFAYVVTDINKRTKSKQNRTKPSMKWKAWKVKVNQKVNQEKVKVKDETKELLNGPIRTHLIEIENQIPCDYSSINSQNSARFSIHASTGTTREEPHLDVTSTLQRLLFYCTPPAAADVVILNLFRRILPFVPLVLRFLLRLKLLRSESLFVGDFDDESNGDDDACVKIPLVTPLRSAVVIPSSRNQGGSSTTPAAKGSNTRDSRGKGIMVSDAAAPSIGASRPRPSSRPAPSFKDVSRGGVAGNCEFTRKEWDAPYRPTFGVLPKEGFKVPAVCKTFMDKFPTLGEMVRVESLSDDQLTAKMSVMHYMMMSHGGELLARYHGLNQSHHDYVLSTNSRLKGYEEKVASLTRLELQVSSLKKQVSGLNNKLSSSDASFAKSKSKGKKRKKMINAGFERGLSMHQTKDEFAVVLKKMANFMPGAQDRLVEASLFVTQTEYAFLNKIYDHASEPLSVILQLEPETLVQLSTNVVPASSAIASEQNEERGVSHTLDDLVEVTVVGSERASSGPNNVVVALSVCEKGNGSLLSFVVDEDVTVNPFGV
nr:hypothetical protein [Tanacetum cinerariifolium]